MKLKLSELISKLIKINEEPLRVRLVDIFECKLGELIYTDCSWEIVSHIPIDVFKSDVVEITFYPTLHEVLIMIDEVLYVRD